jgi:hypothetical protein
MPPSTSTGTSRGAVGGIDDRHLVLAGYLFLVGSAVHMLDHLRRGQGSVTDALNRVGTAGLVVQVIVITLILTHHRRAPLVAAGAGSALALGFAAAHWLPHWSSLSDSFIDQRVAAFSYVASALEIAGAAAIAVVGTRLYLRRSER